MLARKAASVRGREALAGWLYRVASRVATKARTAKWSVPTPDDVAGHDDATQDVSWREALAVLDEELVRLPAAYRSALVLCYLEGRTQDEAARQLGWTLGTLRGQLERAREKLRARMLRRGVGLPAALFGVALGGGSTSTACATAIARLAVGQRSAVPPRVTELADEGTRTMFTVKTKLGAALVFAAGALAAALGVAAQPGDPPKGPPPAKATTPPAVPAAKTDANGDPLPEGAVLRLGTVRLGHAKLFALAVHRRRQARQLRRRLHRPRLGPGDRPARPPAAGREGDNAPLLGRPPVPGRQAGRRAAVEPGEGVRHRVRQRTRDRPSWGARSTYVPGSRRTAGRSPWPIRTSSARRTRLQLCDVDKNACRDLGRVRGYFSDPVFNPDGKRVALAEGSNGVGVWEVATGREVLRFKPPGLLGGTVAFDPTGDVLAVLGAVNPPQAFHFVRVSTGQPPDGWAAPSVADFEWVRFTPDRSAVLCGGRRASSGATQRPGR